jgi:hypothetical protein
MINRKSIVGALVGLLLLTGVIGANLVMASGRHSTAPAVRNEVSTSDGQETGANETSDGPESGNETADGQESGSKETAEGQENDKHEDPAGADHQCPPDCDTANGEKP